MFPTQAGCRADGWGTLAPKLAWYRINQGSAMGVVGRRGFCCSVSNYIPRSYFRAFSLESDEHTEAPFAPR
eukprot:11960887-Karenia_brevis.AAC.1